MNVVVLTGNLVKDIELRKTQSGSSVAQFTLGVKRDYKTGDEYLTDFIDCVAWNQSAEYLASYASKGLLIEVSGSLTKRDYENNEGKKVYITEVKVDKCKILSKKEDSVKHVEMREEAPVKKEVVFETDELPFY